MTVVGTAALDTSILPVEGPVAARPVLEVVHDHDWRLLQVDFSDGACVKEYGCASCPAAWFA